MAISKFSCLLKRASMELIWVLGIITLFRQYQRLDTAPTNVQYIRNDNADSRLRSQSVKALKFPETCSEHDLTITKYHIPDFRCRKTAQRPWMKHCSFSYATRCPNPSWLSDRRTAVLVDSSESGLLPLSVLGRMPGGPQYHEMVEAWQTVNPDYQRTPCPVQEISNDLPKSSQPAMVHVLHSSMSEFKKVHGIVEKLPNAYKKHIQVEAFQVQPLLSTLQVEAPEGELSPHIRLEAYLEQNHIQTLDYLRLGGDSFAPDIIDESGALLEHRVKYLEVEYTFKNTWQHAKLSSVVTTLSDFGFVCYWAGAFDNIWRITGCFQEYFNLKFWSNIACVNLALDADLADTMETMYQATLAKGYRIHYLSDHMILTDGTKWKMREIKQRNDRSKK